MNELQEQYGDRIEFIRFDLNAPEGNCEYDRQGLAHLPAMLYIDVNGATMEKTEALVEKNTLQQKLESLLKK
ncbi:MAG: hypothetical protein WC935_06235 [Thermoleophilia bacterium]